MFKKLAKFYNRGHLKLFACSIEVDISFQTLQNFWVVKALMSSYILDQNLKTLILKNYKYKQKAFNIPVVRGEWI